MSQRKAIRNKIKQLIEATEAYSTVKCNRFHRYTEADMPSVNVYTLEESSAPYDEAPRKSIRTLKVVIDITRPLPEQPEDGPEINLEDVLDDDTTLVENIFNNNRLLGGLLNDSEIESTVFDLEEGGEQVFGNVKMIYQVSYFSKDIPSPLIENFNKFSNKINNDVRTVIESEDSFNEG